MRFIVANILLLIGICQVGCNGCMNNLYQVHADAPDLNIRYVDLNVDPDRVLSYLDSCESRDTTNFSIVKSFNKDTIYKKQRIIFFKSKPEEYYRVESNGFSFWIIGIFNRDLDSANWIFEKEKLSNENIVRIKTRLQKEILNNIK